MFFSPRGPPCFPSLTSPSFSSPLSLHHQRTAWRAERATLLTNMSSLFLTAKAELARKDVAIKEARAGR